MISYQYSQKNEILSPRYQKSPYLSPVLGILRPRYQTRIKQEKYVYPYQQQNQEFPPDFDPIAPKSSRARLTGEQLTYVQRTRDFHNREKNFDKKLSEKYKISNPMDPYKSSMYGAYKKSLITAKKENKRREQIQYETTTQFKRQRLLQNYNEVVEMHRKQAREEINDDY